MKKIATTVERANRVANFLSDSVDDYLAARVLFNKELASQGAILSSTAIEKALKAILALHGNMSRGHLKTAHWNAAKNFDPDLFQQLNVSFLKLNKKAYDLRYLESLRVGFNLVICVREFLAELDHTIMLIHSKFGDSSPLVHLVRTRDVRLTTENFRFSEISKDEFVRSAAQFVFALRVLPMGCMKATYRTANSAEPIGFEVEGLKPS